MCTTPSPCKTCGTCPTCGRKPQPTYNQPYWYYPQYYQGFATTAGFTTNQSQANISAT